MVEYVTDFDYLILHQILCCKWGFKLSLTISDQCIIRFILHQEPLKWPGHFISMIMKSDVGLNSKKTVTHSTIKVLRHSTSQNFVTAFPSSLSRAYPNEHEDKLQYFAMAFSTFSLLHKFLMVPIRRFSY